MSAWWDKKAGQLQQTGRITESAKDDSYSAAEIKRAIVYTREDIILVVSYFSSLNRQAAGIKRLLMFITLFVGLIAFRLFMR